MKELIQLQQKRIIVMKRCDKGAGIIIINCKDYVNACNTHLNSILQHPDGTLKPYYIKVNKASIDKSKLKLTNLLQEGLDNEIITKEHFTAMDPKAKLAAMFYMTFKIHKEHAHGKTPPERPICSGSGTMLENACKFVEHYIKEIGTSHKTYLKDTPDFLRYVEHLNQTESFENSLLLTIDVICLFTNIPESDGI